MASRYRPLRRERQHIRVSCLALSHRACIRASTPLTARGGGHTQRTKPAVKQQPSRLLGATVGPALFTQKSPSHRHVRIHRLDSRATNPDSTRPWSVMCVYKRSFTAPRPTRWKQAPPQHSNRPSCQISSAEPPPSATSRPGAPGQSPECSRPRCTRQRRASQGGLVGCVVDG